MGVFEKMKLYRGMGRFLETGIGAAAAAATGDLVNRGVAGAAPRLEGEVPWTAWDKPLADSRVALVSTGGLHLASDPPFDVDVQEGDASFRELPLPIDPAQVQVSHTHFAHRYVDRDLNVLFPVDRLRELEQAGRLRQAPRYFSFGYAGTLTSDFIDPQRGTAHALARLLLSDEVDLALLVPA